MGGKVSLVAEEDLEVTLHARLDLIILQVLKSMHDVYPCQAWLDLTHLSRKRILTALDAFLALMEPHNKAVIRSIQVLSGACYFQKRC